MQPQLTADLARQHTADLQRAADHDRPVHAATTASSSDAAGRPVAAAPVTLTARLRRRSFKRTRRHGKAGQVEG
jgi:hypothetical protein